MALTLKRTADTAIGRQTDRINYLAGSTLLKEPIRIVSDLTQDNDRAGEKLLSAFQEAIGEKGNLISERRHQLTLLHPVKRLESVSGRFSLLANRLASSALAQCQALSERCTSAASALKNLGPDSVLSRGYSITLDENGNLVESAKSTKPGERIVSRLSDGEIRSVVE